MWEHPMFFCNERKQEQPHTPFKDFCDRNQKVATERSQSHQRLKPQKEPTSSSTLTSPDDDKESSSCHQGIEIKEIYHTDSPKDSSSMGSHSGNKSQGPFSTSSLSVSADEKKSSGPSSSSTFSFLADDEDSSSRFSRNQSPDEVKKRREKRLAKNRESARKRRKLKAELIDDLQNRVLGLTKQNEELMARLNVLESMGNDTSSSTVFSPSTSLTSSVAKLTSDLSSASSLSSSLSSSKSTAPPPLPPAPQQKKQQLQQQQELTFENLQELLIHQMYEKILSGGVNLGAAATSDFAKNQEEEAQGSNNLLLSLFKSQENNPPTPSSPSTQQLNSSNEQCQPIEMIAGGSLLEQASASGKKKQEINKK